MMGHRLRLYGLNAELDWSSAESFNGVDVINILGVFGDRILFSNFMDAVSSGIGICLIVFFKRVKIVFRVVVLTEVQLVIHMVLWHQRQHAFYVLLAFLGSENILVKLVCLQLDNNLSDCSFEIHPRSKVSVVSCCKLLLA